MIYIKFITSLVSTGWRIRLPAIPLFQGGDKAFMHTIVKESIDVSYNYPKYRREKNR